jgi:hypoxanthine-guanine phosphoribosyltransferase
MNSLRGMSDERLLQPARWDGESYDKTDTNRAIQLAKLHGLAAILHTPEVIDRRISEIAEYERRQLEKRPDTVYLSLDGGGRPLSSRLMHALGSMSETGTPIYPISYSVKVGSYGPGQNAGALEIKCPLDKDINLEGVPVVIVDDAVDTGHTCKELVNHLYNPERIKKLGAGVTGAADSVRIIAGGDKGISKIDEYADLVLATTLPNAWGAGCGFDSFDFVRGLPEKYRWMPAFGLTVEQDAKYLDGLREIAHILGERMIVPVSELAIQRDGQPIQNPFATAA